ncbi:Uncharacterised protein [Vibrio cholerae]|nr:Uncharacterised protein [Vibrio cholerae]
MASQLSKRVVVVHQQDQGSNQYHAAEHCGGHCPLIEWNFENLKNCNTQGGVSQDQQ